MRILFLGTPEFAAVCLDGLLNNHRSIVGIVTQPDRAKGRDLVILPPPVKTLALSKKIPVYQPEKLDDPSFLDQIRALKPDCAIVVAFGRLLPPVFLDLFPKGAYNLHGSLLPKYRGAAPIQRALINGETETGVTLFKLDEQLDHGPILLQKKLAIDPSDTTFTLFPKMAALASTAILEGISLLEKEPASLTPQNHAEATQAPALTKEQGRINWTKPAVAIVNQIRGMTLWPGAYTSLNGERLKILSATAIPDTNSPAQPGTVLDSSSKIELIIQTGQGRLQINRLQPAAGKPMPAADFLHGHPIPLGTLLGS